MALLDKTKDMLQRERGRQANPPSRRSRSRSRSIGSRRPCSASSESRSRRSSSRDARSSSRRQSKREQTADRSKADMMNQHKMLHELQRLMPSRSKKMEMNRGRVGLRNEGERNAWIYLVVTQCVVLASVATYEQNATAALTFCIMQLLLSLFRAVYLLRTEHGYNAGNERSQNMMSLRITLLSLTLQSIINPILLGRTNDLAVTGLVIWDHNMFYGCWVSFCLISYLFASAVAAVLHGSSSEKGFKSGSNLQRRHQFCKLMSMLWTMHLLFQICVLASSISIQASQICGGMLGTTASCQEVTTTLILSVFNIPLCAACLLNISSFVELSDLMLVRVYGVSASVSLLIQAITTGLITSVGGLASNSGNLYVSTWINTLIGLTIVLRCMDGYWWVISSSSEPLKLDDHEASEEQARPQSALVRVPSVRSNKTASTGSSRENELIKNSGLIEASSGPPRFLALQAPPAYSEPTTELVIMREPEPSNNPDGRNQMEPEVSNSRSQRQQPPSVWSRTTRSSNVPSNYISIAPEPPSFETSQSRPPPQEAQAYNVREPRRTFMEPVTEEDDFRNSSSTDPPPSIPGTIEDELRQSNPRSSSPGSIQDAAYYHSSSEIPAHYRAKDVVPSKNQSHRNTLTSMQSEFKSTFTISSLDDANQETTMPPKQKSKGYPSVRGSIASKSKGSSISSGYSRKLTITKEEVDMLAEYLVTDHEADSILSDYDEIVGTNAASSSKFSSSLGNIDD